MSFDAGRASTSGMKCDRVRSGWALHSLRFAIAASALLLCLGATPVSTGLPTVELRIKGHRVIAEVAATEESRTTGLMYRFSLKPDGGMLFVFGNPQPLAFWMKNTYVPLSIAFIDAEGRIVNIEDMAPRTEDTHSSRGLALYALEMKKGWFGANGIGPGDRVEGLAKVPRGSD
jgi:uncharacterized membrane protein (UPF0127 family)